MARFNDFDARFTQTQTLFLFWINYFLTNFDKVPEWSLWNNFNYSPNERFRPIGAWNTQFYYLVKEINKNKK